MTNQKTLAEKALEIVNAAAPGRPPNSDTPNDGIDARHADRREQPAPGGDLLQGGQRVSMARSTGARAAGSKGRD